MCFFLLAPITWEACLACLIVLDNSWEVFGCSVVTDVKSVTLGLSKDFVYWVAIFDRFIGLCISFLEMIDNVL